MSGVLSSARHLLLVILVLVAVVLMALVVSGCGDCPPGYEKTNTEERIMRDAAGNETGRYTVWTCKDRLWR